MVECLILFTGFTDALWPLNLNISDDFKVHSKGAFNNYVDNMRGKGSKMSSFVHAQGIKTVHEVKKWQKVFYIVVEHHLNHLLPIYLIC